MSSVTDRLKKRRDVMRAKVEKQLATDYAPSAEVPEAELRAIAKVIVDFAFGSVSDLKRLVPVTQALRSKVNQVKANSKIDMREWQAAIEGTLWEKSLTEELRKTYTAMGVKLN